MPLSQWEDVQLRSLLAQIGQAGGLTPVSTPMSYQGPEEFWCCQCYGVFPNAEATWDTTGTIRVDVCAQCRIKETYWLIRKCASYE